MTTNDRPERIEAAQLADVTGGGIGDWYAKAKEVVKQGVDYVKQHPEVLGTGPRLPTTFPRR